MLTISTTGATVPAFTESLTFPENATTSAPTSVSKSGLQLDWSPIADPVIVGFTQYFTSEPTISISCTYPGAAGTASISSSQMADLIANDSVVVGVTTQERVTGMAGQFPLDIRAAQFAFESTLTLQP